MIKMLRFQFRNFSRQILNYFCVLLALLQVGLQLYGVTHSEEGLGIFDIRLAAGFDMFLLILICTLSTFDTENGTVKNIIAKGYNKVIVLFSKYIVAIVVTLIFAALKVSMCLIYAKFKSVDIPGVWQVLWKDITILIPQVLIYVTVAVVAGKFKGGFWLSFLIQLIPLGLMKISETLSHYWVTGLSELNTIPMLIMSLVYIMIAAAVGIFAVQRKEIK